MERLIKKVESIEESCDTEEEVDQQISMIDVQLLLSIPFLPLNSRVRRRIATAFRRQEQKKHEARELREDMEEREMRPVHIPIGKGATMVVWSKK